ncbi:MAG: hypothetical protein HeimC2_35740 [Candidatus Heimdallarchaeota archaeon LC_2]|nr:MAG: hypothetical protein HeimC2_35740 [Candidatus Heimdallarchaeota archaeon LC_2]
MINQIDVKPLSDPTITYIRGDNIIMVYIFQCGCELYSNYKRLFGSKIKCGRHSSNILIEEIEKTKNWSKIKFIDENYNYYQDGK